MAYFVVLVILIILTQSNISQSIGYSVTLAVGVSSSDPPARATPSSSSVTAAAPAVAITEAALAKESTTTTTSANIASEYSDANTLYSSDMGQVMSSSHSILVPRDTYASSLGGVGDSFSTHLGTSDALALSGSPLAGHSNTLGLSSDIGAGNTLYLSGSNLANGNHNYGYSGHALDPNSHTLGANSHNLGLNNNNLGLTTNLGALSSNLGASNNYGVSNGISGYHALNPRNYGDMGAQNYAVSSASQVALSGVPGHPDNAIEGTLSVSVQQPYVPNLNFQGSITGVQGSINGGTSGAQYYCGPVPSGAGADAAAANYNGATGIGVSASSGNNAGHLAASVGANTAPNMGANPGAGMGASASYGAPTGPGGATAPGGANFANSNMPTAPAPNPSACTCGNNAYLTISSSYR